MLLVEWTMEEIKKGLKEKQQRVPTFDLINHELEIFVRCVYVPVYM